MHGLRHLFSRLTRRLARILKAVPSVGIESEAFAESWLQERELKWRQRLMGVKYIRE